MKIYQLVAEDQDLDEAPVGKLQRAGQAIGRFFGSDHASGQEDISDEANELKKNLSRWMGRSGIKKGQLTLDDLETFLDQVGYGGLAASVIDQARNHKSLGQRVKDKAKAVGAGARAGVDAARTAYRQASQESINENETDFLDNKLVDRILLAVVKKAAKTGSKDFKKGKFAQDSKSSDSKGSNKVDDILKSLSDEEKSQLAAALGGQSVPKSSAPSKGDVGRGPDGDEYVWLGAAWRNKRTGKMAKRDIANQIK